MANLMTVSTEDDAVRIDILAAVEYETAEWGRLHRFPPHLRENKKLDPYHHSQIVYDPVVLSLGPYHHGQVDFPQIDGLKEEVYNYMLKSIGGNRVMNMFRQTIRKKINTMRNFYGGVSMDKYGDEELTNMMVHDTCFVLYCMEMATGDRDKKDKVLHCLGLSGYSFMLCDFFLLDNQIPLCVIKLLISLKYVDNKGEELLCKFLSHVNFGDDRLKQLPWIDDERQPLHLLEACRAALVKEERGFRSTERKRTESNSTAFELVNSPFRSVTDLIAKGVHFRPSSYSLRDIRFNSYGTLQLPILFVTNNTKVFFSNVIAFEMSPEPQVDSTVMLSYINFMKSLIQKPEDVKVLREKGILFSRLGNDEEVVNIFKDIDAYGIDGNDFLEVKMRIDQHCNSKAKTWMAELIHSNFRNPWTVIALFAAIFLLCLTFLQTYYAIHPR